MSQENVEIVQQAFEAATVDPPDAETLNRLYSPDHVLTTDWGATEVEQYVGLAGFRRAMADMELYLSDWHQDLFEFIDAGDGWVVVVGQTVAAGRSSGVPVKGAWSTLVELRDGMIVSTRFFQTREEALEAARLSE